VAPRHRLRFAVRAGHDAHVALIPRNRGACHELVLGGWGNSAVALRSWVAGTLPDHTASHLSRPDKVWPAPALLSAGEWRAVTIELVREFSVLSVVLMVEEREIRNRCERLSFTHKLR
jgi:hypothetical protein